MKEIAFTKVALPYGWMGNMAPFPIHFADRDWRTSEALFQALRFADPDIRSKIWREKSPMGAKIQAKKHIDQMIVKPRSTEDLANMNMVLRYKLTQHQELVKQLKETGDVPIIEDCSNRRNDSGLFWGAANIDGVWVGRNELGKMLMDLRDLISGEGWL